MVHQDELEKASTDAYLTEALAHTDELFLKKTYADELRLKKAYADKLLKEAYADEL